MGIFLVSWRTSPILEDYLQHLKAYRQFHCLQPLLQILTSAFCPPLLLFRRHLGLSQLQKRSDLVMVFLCFNFSLSLNLNPFPSTQKDFHKFPSGRCHSQERHGDHPIPSDLLCHREECTRLRCPSRI